MRSLALLLAAATRADDHCGELAFTYFAVGGRTLAKARVSARSARRVHPNARTLLFTDARGVAAAEADRAQRGDRAEAGPGFLTRF